MNLGPFWAHVGTLIAGGRALPAALALVWLCLAPAAGLALVIDVPDAILTQPDTSPRMIALSLAGEPGRSDASTPMAAGAARERRLNISLFSGGGGSTLAVRPPPSISGLAAGATPNGTNALSAILGPGDGNGHQASLYRLSYAGGPVAISGRIIDVGSRFSLASAGGGASAEDAEAIAQAIGSRGMSLSGAWKLGAGLSLTSSHDTLHHDDILSAEHGLTAANTSHALALSLGRSTSVKASLTQHQEEWDRWLGRPGKQNREERVELNTGFGHDGASGLRLAMATVQSAEGENRSQQNTREAHLNLAPAGRLRLNADYVMNGQGGGNAQTTRGVGAALKLTPNAELTATMNAQDPSAGEGKRELALALAAKVAGGQFGAEQKTTRGPEGLVDSRKVAFAGAVGGGPTPTNVKVDLQESRGDTAEAQLNRNNLIHVDRRVATWLTIAAERREAAKGTTAAPEVSAQTKYEAAAQLGAQTEVSAGLVTGDRAGARQGERRLAISHKWPGLRLRAENGTWADGANHRSRLSYAVEIPAGDLPDWAKTISSAHQFSDAQQYTLGRRAEWAFGEMAFVGYRLWTTKRAGGSDQVNTVGFAHRRIVGGRYHVQVSLEDRPEGTEGETKGRPLPLRRQAVEISRRVTDGVNLRCGLGLQSGLSSPDDRLGRMRLGLWGRLRRGDQVEGELWRESGQWDQAAVERTSVTMLYSHRVSDENRVELKVGYTWGAGSGGDRQRDCRFAFALERPM